MIRACEYMGNANLKGRIVSIYYDYDNCTYVGLYPGVVIEADAQSDVLEIMEQKMEELYGI